eukprot:7391351-Prymnesium_polylepis.1
MNVCVWVPLRTPDRALIGTVLSLEGGVGHTYFAAVIFFVTGNRLDASFTPSHSKACPTPSSQTTFSAGTPGRRDGKVRCESPVRAFWVVYTVCVTNIAYGRFTRSAGTCRK